MALRVFVARGRLPIYTDCVRSCYPVTVSGPATRVNVQLDEQRALKLKRLAERTHVNPGTLARSLLSTALDDADPDAASVTSLLDGIDGAWERAQQGAREARRGEGIALEDL